MELTPLAPRARLLFYLQAFGRLFFFWVPATVGAGVLLSLFWSMIGGGVLALLWIFLMFLMSVWYPTYAFEHWGYAVRDEELLIARGVFFRSVTAIPICRIQHVDTRQGPLEQWFGLARLQVYTASGLGADGVVPGIELDKAEVLRDSLVKVRGDDGV
jgi:uncharacterized protein